MYIPKHNEETRVEVMHALMRAQPLATLVTLSAGGIAANHIPLQINADASFFGVLHGHVARANPVWRETLTETESLAIFQGPQVYIHPGWYATKPQTGKVVPTWNYVVVHAYGTLRVIDDPVWVRAQIERLTAASEASFAQPWQVTDAPEEYIDKMVGAIVGIELVVTRLFGKWKTSQNQPAANRAGVIQGLEEIGTDDALAMADFVPGERLEEVG